jgi:hypothetical protein
VGALYAALGGAAVTALLASVRGYLRYLAGSQRNLSIATLRCRDRLAKIEYAFERLPAELDDQPWRHTRVRIACSDWRRKTIDSELDKLGSDLDSYLDSIAPIRSSRLRARHVQLYEKMRPILIEHDLRLLPRVRKRLDREIKRDAPLLSRPWVSTVSRPWRVRGRRLARRLRPRRS